MCYYRRVIILKPSYTLYEHYLIMTDNKSEVTTVHEGVMTITSSSRPWKCVINLDDVSYMCYDSFDRAITIGLNNILTLQYSNDISLTTISREATEIINVFVNYKCRQNREKTGAFIKEQDRKDEIAPREQFFKIA